MPPEVCFASRGQRIPPKAFQGGSQMAAGVGSSRQDAGG